MKSKWSKILFWVFVFLPFAFSAALYNRLPARLATHFNAAGAPNGYSSRMVAAFGLPAFYAGMTLLVFVMMKIDPKSRNIEGSPQIKAVVLWGVALVFNLCQAAILLTAMNVKIDISAVVGIAVGVLFVGIGNYLPKCKPNYTVGIRLPWTLASEDNWRKTHRFAGPLWIAGGVVIALGLVFRASASLILVVAVVLCIVPGVYSYLLFRREKANKP